LKIQVKIGGENTDEGASICENIGMIYEMGKQRAKALDYFYRALHIRRKLYGDKHQEVKKLEDLIDVIIHEQRL